MIKEIDKPKEPPQIAVKFANMVFALGILYSILIIIYAIYKIYNSPQTVSQAFYIISMLSGGVLATLFSLVLKRLSNNLKVNLSLLFFTIGIAIYGFETYLVLIAQKGIIAKGVPYDWRTKTEVLVDLRNSGIEAFPNSYPTLLLKSNGLTGKQDKEGYKGRIYPIGTISNSTTIFSNESGYHPIVETDEHGFNNSKGLYIENKVDIVLTGDSFTEGIAVHSNESISAVLRQLDFNAISVGKGGNGSLLELAALKEYAEPLKPKIVLWLYTDSDLDDLENEMKSYFLRKYLNEDDYSQNLISRQEEIDGVLINYLQNEWEKLRVEEKEDNPRIEKEERERAKMDKIELERIKKENDKKERERAKERIIKLLKLTELRGRIINLILVPAPTTAPTTPTPAYSYTLTPTPTSATTPTLAPIFRDILQKSKQMVSEWGGQMYFAYLPLSPASNLKGKKHPNIDFVIQAATELDIPIIDIHREVLDHPDPLSLFPFRKHGHYNAKGYKLVAETIRERLEADGYVPITSRK